MSRKEKTGQTMSTGIQTMSRYKTNTDATLVESAPIFASVWLAFFYVIRDNFFRQQTPAEQEAENHAEVEN